MSNSTPHSTRKSLLDLPNELLNVIMEEVLVSNEPIPAGTADSYQPGVLSSCRWIRNQYLPFFESAFYTKNVFTLMATCGDVVVERSRIDDWIEETPGRYLERLSILRFSCERDAFWQPWEFDFEVKCEETGMKLDILYKFKDGQRGKASFNSQTGREIYRQILNDTGLNGQFPLNLSYLSILREAVDCGTRMMTHLPKRCEMSKKDLHYISFQFGLSQGIASMLLANDSDPAFSQAPRPFLQYVDLPVRWSLGHPKRHHVTTREDKVHEELFRLDLCDE